MAFLITALDTLLPPSTTISAICAFVPRRPATLSTLPCLGANK